MMIRINECNHGITRLCQACRNKNELEDSRKRIAELEAQVVDWKLAMGGLRCAVSFPTSTMGDNPQKIKNELIDQYEAQVRPAEGMPSYKELVDIITQRCSSNKSVGVMFELLDGDEEQLCAALGRDPASGEKGK